MMKRSLTALIVTLGLTTGLAKADAAETTLPKLGESSSDTITMKVRQWEREGLLIVEVVDQVGQFAKGEVLSGYTRYATTLGSVSMCLDSYRDPQHGYVIKLGSGCLAYSVLSPEPDEASGYNIYAEFLIEPEYAGLFGVRKWSDCTWTLPDGEVLQTDGIEKSPQGSPLPPTGTTLTCTFE